LAPLSNFCWRVTLLSLIEGNNFSRAKKVEIIFDENERILADFMDDQFDVVFATVQKSSTERKEWVSQDLSYPVRLFGPSSLTEGFEARGGQAQSTGVSCLIELANSKNISLVLPTSSSLRDETDTFLSGSTVKPLRTIECNRSGGIVQLIERGFAMGFVPTPCLLDFKSAQALAVLGPPGGYWSHRLSILVHKDHKDVKKSVDKKHKLTDLFLSAEFN
jgi:DNA-binding transcriptional LysR family regulator